MYNSIILSVKNAKFSGYYFDMNLNITGDFQICISVPLKSSGLLHGLFGYVTDKKLNSQIRSNSFLVILWKNIFAPTS